MKKLSLILGLLAYSAFSSAHATNLITNGGFETGDFTGWSTGGDNTFTGITTTAPHTGNLALQAGPTIGNFLLDQSFTTSPGSSYDLSFWLANGAISNNSFAASIDGFVHSLLALSDSNAFGYTAFNYSFTATSASTTLSFRAFNEPDYWYLDDVSVTAIPEPTTLSMLGLGYLALRISRKNRLAV